MGPRTTSPTFAFVGDLPLTIRPDPQSKSKKKVRSLLELVSILRVDVAKRKLHILLFLAAAGLFSIFHQSHQYYKTVKLNRLTLSQGEPPEHAWWRGQSLTIWTIWIGDDVIPPPIIQAAMQSCRNVHAAEPNLFYHVITNDDLHTLDFDLHPSFWLLDNVEKSDYLRGELLHYHGGFYMDADVLCLKSFPLLNNFAAGAAQDRTHYGPWPSVSQNALGPFQAQSPITTAWHDLLMSTMDELTPGLNACAQEYAPEPIPYPTPRKYGTSMCGVPWGGIIDFVKPIWLQFYEKQQLGHDLSMCDVYGRHLGWDNDKKCDIVHLGTAGDFFGKKKWDMEKLCQELPVMQSSQHCSSRDNLITRERIANMSEAEISAVMRDLEK